MGLGKTFQALAAVAIKVKERRKGKKKHNTISLVVCPGTLVHNWNNEIKKFFTDKDLKGAVFDEVVSGGIKKLKKNIVPKIDILIMSYDRLRNYGSHLTDINFLYVILDEAHLIKNSKSLTTQTAKGLKSERKLILTGTPLQNRVTELWSIFDFLMPGFLEDESVFNRKYTKYLSTNLKKLGKNEDQTEQFLTSIKNLRERISPFILRRTKENVLKELPEKIVQDYNCPMSDLQIFLHDILERQFPYTEGMRSIDIKATDMSVNKSAIENLLAHRKICNHPRFILNDQKIMRTILEEHNDTTTFNEKLKSLSKGIPVYEQSGKLKSLLSLLEECGMVSFDTNEDKKNDKEDTVTESTFLAATEDGNYHRALIFCQMKNFQKMVEDEILKRFKVSYLKLDSSLNPKQRFE